MICSHCLLAQDSTITNSTPAFSSDRIAAPQPGYVWPEWTPPESPAATNSTVGLHKRRPAHEGDHLYWGPSYDYRRLNGDYDSLTQAALSFEVVEDRNTLGLLLSAGSFDLKLGSVADVAAHQPLIGELGLSGKHFFTPQHTFLRPYVAGNLTAAWMAWEYRHPTISGDEIIHHDSMKGVGAYAGCGLSIRASRNLSLFGEFGAGGMMFVRPDDRQTETVFNDFGYLAVKAGLNVVF
jgi:hypothetical protein